MTSVEFEWLSSKLNWSNVALNPHSLVNLLKRQDSLVWIFDICLNSLKITLILSLNSWDSMLLCVANNAYFSLIKHKSTRSELRSGLNHNCNSNWSNIYVITKLHKQKFEFSIFQKFSKNFKKFCYFKKMTNF